MRTPILIQSLLRFTVAVVAGMYFMLVFPPSFAGVAQADDSCKPRSIDDMDLSPEAGALIYETQGGFQTIAADYSGEIEGEYRGKISPDGLHLVTAVEPDPTSNVRQVVVLNRKGQRIYTGASFRGGGDLHWLGNDRILAFSYSLVGRSPGGMSSGAVFRTTQYIIDPFARTYVPSSPKYEDPFNLVYRIVTPFQLTYDGRYIMGWGAALDILNEEVLELENYVAGIPSSTSYRFLLIEYNNRNYLPEDQRIGSHPVDMYDLQTDTRITVSSLNSDAPLIFSQSSWSPNENYLIYVPDYSTEITFRPVTLLNLMTDEQITTCLGQFYEIDTYSFNDQPYARVWGLHFAWSRDSRYVAMQGVLAGEDLDDSLGLYIYDTQANHIYKVHSGRAHITGWMAN